MDGWREGGRDGWREGGMEEGRKGGREEGREGGGVGWSETFGCAVCERKERATVLRVHGITIIYTHTHTHTHTPRT